HVHEATCYEQILQCALEEKEGHAHGEDCYAWTQETVCGLEEGPVPTQTPAETAPETEAATEATQDSEEYFQVPDALELICGEVQADVHVHGEECFHEAQQSLTCTLPEDGHHTHNELCYGIWELRCEVEEHTHNTACYSNPEADLEVPADWEKTFADVELTGVWQQDVLAIAKTQLGYTESTDNYFVNEAGVQKGYTRYGAWYGDHYGDWCAMFVSFCMHYGGVEGIPIHSGCVSWIRELQDMNLYRKQGKYLPEAGDIIFFDWECDGLSDHVGLVYEYKDATDTELAQLVTIEGNSSNRVQFVTYDPEDVRIAGYGQLSRNRLVSTYCGKDEHTHDEACYDEAGVLLCTIEEHIHSEECNSYKVVYYDNQLKAFANIHGVSDLPEDLSLKVTPIIREEDPQTFDSMSIALSEEMATRTEYVGASAFYSFRLFSQGQPYELPEGASVSVEMSFHQPVFTAEQMEEANGVHTYLITPDPEATEPTVDPTEATDESTEETTEPSETTEPDETVDPGQTVEIPDVTEPIPLPVGNPDESASVDVVPAGRVETDIPDFLTGLQGGNMTQGAQGMEDNSEPTQTSATEAPTEPTQSPDAEEPTEPEAVPIFEAAPAPEEKLQRNEDGTISGLSFRSGEIATVALALTRQTVTGTFWERVHSTSEITSGGTYIIVSAEGNYALVGNSSGNYKRVTLQTVKDNEKYYIIPESSDANIQWTFTGSGSSFTMRNKGTSRYLNLNSSTFISSSSSSNTLTYQSLEHTWRISYRRTLTTNRLQNAGTGSFSRSSSNNNQTDMLIFKLSDVTSLEVPADVIISAEVPGATPDGEFQMPDYEELVDPSGSKAGDTSLTGTVGNSAVTIKGEYYSDPATSDIERQYQEKDFADHEKNDGKVLSDKSVIYMADDYGAFTDYDPNTFSVALSTMAQEYKVPYEEIVKTPIDVVFVLDISGSMSSQDSSGSDPSRIYNLMEATNKAIKQIMDDHPSNRVGISVYTGGAWELLPLDRYVANDDKYLTVTGADTPNDTSDDFETYTHAIENASIKCRFLYGSASLKNEAGKSFANVGKDFTQGLGTYTQAGIAVGRSIFKAIGDDTTYTTTMGTDDYQREITVIRQPVMVLISDGEPTYSTNIYMDPLNGPHYGDGSGLNHDDDSSNSNAQGIHGYYTVLTANYVKRMISIQYQKPVLFYTVGIKINDEESGDGPMVTGSHTGDNYKRAVLNPARDAIENLISDSTAANIDPVITADQMKALMLGQYQQQWVKVVRGGWEEVELGVPHYYLPVLQPNPYAEDYSYADKGYFGEIDLKEVFADIIKNSLQASPYGFVLYRNNPIDIQDNIGAGMEIKGDPILRYNGVNYTRTSVSTVGPVTTYVYDYIHKDPYIPKHEAQLSSISVKIVRNDDGTQSVILYVPDEVLPTYTPELTHMKDYYEMLPVRLIYQVGLTAESEERVLALQETGGELTFYTNKWQSLDEVAKSTLIPADMNPYYNDIPDDGLTPQYHEHHDKKEENTTGTRENATDCSKYTDTQVDNRSRILHYLGNNGKLVFRADSTEIPVEKHWEEVNADIMNPVTVDLYRVTETLTEEGTTLITGTFVAQKQLDINNQWKDVFTGVTIPDGDWYYVIVENYVPGYQPFYNGDLVTFTVDNTPMTGVKVDFDRLKTEPVRVTNAPAVELPSTGGPGTILYTLGGCFLIAAAGISLMYTKQSKGRKGGKAHP
ncbi:MAG: CHAP domain-containing protein, partial [Oscillospiraceae bacterium]|nr:CHAP domain-containing protein [Oscillospiraceae bacterium]